MKIDGQTENRREKEVIVDKDQEIVTICTPVSGIVYPISDVADQTFSKELVGKGIAIMPDENTIVSPITGAVTVAFKTKHAMGLTSKEGIEVLIHVGLDTVELEGQHFELLCKEGQTVQVGTPLIQFDREKISELGYDISVVMVIINSDEYLSVLAMDDQKKVKENDALITIVPGVRHGENEVGLVVE